MGPDKRYITERHMHIAYRLHRIRLAYRLRGWLPVVEVVRFRLVGVLHTLALLNATANKWLVA